MQYEDIINEIDSDGNPITDFKRKWTPYFASGLKADMVNHPAHYTAGRTEVIDVIEDAVKSCEDPVGAVLQAQVLKYMLRLWLKEDPGQDASKAKWYLDRLVEHLNNV